jgi:hypothetical protein
MFLANSSQRSVAEAQEKSTSTSRFVAWLRGADSFWRPGVVPILD